MPIFFYQGKVEPVVASPEAVTVDRWAPTWTQPVRRALSVAALAAGMVAPVLTPAPASTPQPDATFVQPARATSRPVGTTRVEPVSTDPEATSAERWLPTFRQAHRTPRYAAGTVTVGPVSTDAEAVSIDRWAPTWTQPARPLASTPGASALVPVVAAAPDTAADRWAPTWVQAPRPVHRAAGTDAAAPVSLAAESTSADRWQPTVVQPARTRRHAAGTTRVEPAAPPPATGTWYHVYGNGGSGPIDYSTPLAATNGLTWASPALSAGTWRFAVRAYDTGSGLEEANVDAAVAITLSAGLADLTAVPAAPAGLAAAATAGGGAHVTWTFPQGQGVQPTGFHVYAGTPTVSYASPVATVPAGAGALPYAAGGAGLVRYKADLTGLADGTSYQVGVRAYNAVGEESNTVVVAVTGNSAAPGNVTNLTAS